ncbi:hypothetical protein [Bradyrhizobium sp. AUGA SZCCT0431]|uniref:hypothetical protein n=1 Tax=Bradyrhizobium sp. AUGA SZCCT0431 TaxID=2807674 RepID=UPI001BA586A3|nr:hypothetical protein [Bradyrhizobium sp. AUGA SZCCT0431]MBR1143683.1 hypothetical protein [Bradyrhizobium sp. AUGA SZCCT0431]
MKEFELYKLVTAIHALGVARASITWQGPMEALKPLAPEIPFRFIDRFVSRKLSQRAVATDLNFEKARTQNRQAIQDGISAALTELIGHLQEFELPVTLAAAKRLKEAVDKNERLAEDKDVGELIFRLIDELRDRKFIGLSNELGKLFNTQQFSADIRLKFPSAVVDIDEAMNCLALERSTASVFHLMRVMEVAVRATASCLGVPNPVRGSDKNWGQMLAQIKSATNLKWPTAVEKMLPDAKRFEDLYVSLDAVRNGWRNTTMHVERTYTMDEAQRIRHAVEGLLIIMAARFDENGSPQA